VAWCLIKHRDNSVVYLEAGIVNRYWKDADGSLPCRLLNFALSQHVLRGCGSHTLRFE
jgi:hypothetical protein